MKHLKKLVSFFVCLLFKLFLFSLNVNSGILLLVDPKNHNDNDYCKVLTSKSLNTDLNEWRQKIRSDSGQFIQLCDQLKMVPNVWSLYEWSNWLTPISVGHRRFDTMFYVCCFEQKPPVFVDNAEVTTPIVCIIIY